MPAFAAALAAGVSGINRITAGLPGAGRHTAACVSESIALRFGAHELALLDRFTQLALLAADEAIRQSALFGNAALCSGTGVYIGTATGGAESVECAYIDMLTHGVSPRPFSILCAMHNSAAGHLSIRLGLDGPSLTFSSACASSSIAIGEAFHAIRAGRLERALAGGAEACLVPGILRAWKSMRVLAPMHPHDPSASCRPFSRNRQGLVLGEGAAMFVLESFDSARGRAIPVLAELLGYGASADASHIANPCVNGQVAAMAAALDDAQLACTDIDYINAHGTGTTAGDVCETRAIRRVLGEHASRVPVSSTKSVHGHLLGAAGALELAAALIAMRDGFIPATMHLEQPDPECDLDYVPNAPRDGVRPRRVMSNSFAFGGSNAVLILGAAQ